MAIGESIKNENGSINNGIEGKGIVYGFDWIRIEIRSLEIICWSKGLCTKLG